jgi:hypothetical protein
MIHQHAFEAVNRTLRDLMKAVDQSLEKKTIWRQGCDIQRRFLSNSSSNNKRNS